MDFCVKCGKKGKTTESFCSDCYVKVKEINLKDIKVKICLLSQKYLSRNKWKSFDDKSELLKKLVQDQIKHPCQIEVSIPKHFPKIGSKVKANITIELEGNEFLIPATITYGRCHGLDKHSAYFESILQIRNPQKDIYKYIEDRIKNRANIFIAKITDTKHGRDYYLSSNQFAMALGKDIQNTFGGELKVTSKLFSKDKMTSKDLYRVTVLIRTPSQSRGDTITLHGEEHKILEFNKKVKVQNLRTGKKTIINYSDL